MNKQIVLSEPPAESEDLEPLASPKPTVLDGLHEDEDVIEFIKNNYPETTIEQWNDWKWQVKNSITKSVDLINILGKKKENAILHIPDNHLPFKITPFFASLLNRIESDHPLYKNDYSNCK